MLSRSNHVRHMPQVCSKAGAALQRGRNGGRDTGGGREESSRLLPGVVAARAPPAGCGSKAVEQPHGHPWGDGAGSARPPSLAEPAGLRRAVDAAAAAGRGLGKGLVLHDGLKQARAAQRVGQRQVPLDRIGAIVELAGPLPAGRGCKAGGGGREGVTGGGRRLAAQGRGRRARVGATGLLRRLAAASLPACPQASRHTALKTHNTPTHAHTHTHARACPRPTHLYTLFSPCTQSMALKNLGHCRAFCTHTSRCALYPNLPPLAARHSSSSVRRSSAAGGGGGGARRRGGEGWGS